MPNPRNHGGCVIQSHGWGNVLPTSFSSIHLWDKPLAPTIKTFRSAPRSILEGVRIIDDVSLRHGNFEVALDFHVFEVHDFDIVIGHPLEKLFLDVPC